MSVEASDLMDSAEVAAALGLSPASIRGALTHPERNPRAARILPKPLRRVGTGWIWRRTDVERVVLELRPPEPEPEPPSTPATRWPSRRERARRVGW